MKLKKVVASLLVATTLTGTTLATTGEKNATVHFDNIKIVLNGKELIPKDATGATVEPFTINGTTYLPVRAIGEALGLEVEWDGMTKTVFLSDTTKDEDATVYITETGKRYHYDSTCNGGTYYESTFNKALERGLTPCDKCVLKEK